MFETLATTVGFAIAKSTLKLWLKDEKLIRDITSDLLVLLQGKFRDYRLQNAARRQFERIAEKAAESIAPIIEIEYRGLEEGEANAAMLEVAKGINGINLTPEDLAEINIDPVRLARKIKTGTDLSTFSESGRALIERVADESSQLVVDFAGNLPGFTERTLGEVLLRESIIMEKIDNVIMEISRVRESTTFINPQTEQARFEESYRRQISRKLDEIELYGADESIAQSSRRHNLTLAYISLRFQQQSRSSSPKGQRGRGDLTFHAPLERERTATLSQSITTVDAVIRDASRIVIRGDAGSGKTTLLQYLAVRTAGASCEGVLESFNTYIPFFIRLRQLSDRPLPRPEEFPSLLAPSINNMMPALWVHEILNKGIGLVLIDGVDEVVDARRDEVKEWILELVTQFPDSRFIVTSRPSAIRPSWINSAGFIEVELLPMQPEDAETFVEHWHAAVGREEVDQDRKSELPGLAKNLIQRLRTDRALRELATSPLLCAMICAMHRDRRQVLPNNRIALYDAALSMLLHRRDIERQLRLSDIAQLEYEEKLSLLQEMAIWLLENGWSSVQETRASIRIEALLPAYPRLPKGLSGALVLKSLLARSGILRSPVEGEIEFIHRTFQEFLAARSLVGSDRLSSLLDRMNNDRWREIAVLASGLSSEARREEFIDALIARGDRSGARQTIYYLVTVACLETAVRLSSSLQDKIRERIAKMRPPVTKAEAKILAAAGDLALPLLEQFSRQSSNCASACVRALRLIASDAAFRLMEQYAADTRIGVADEVIAGWNNFDREKYARLVLSHCPGSRGSIALENPKTLKGIRFLKRISRLEVTMRRDFPDISEFSEISELKELRELVLDASKMVAVNLEFLSSLQQLRFLSLKMTVANISAISKLRKLSRFETSSEMGPSDLKMLEHLQLDNLKVTLSKEIEGLLSLRAAQSLRSLDLAGGGIIDWSSLNGLERLEHLRLARVLGFSDLGVINSCKALRSFSVRCADGGVGNIQGIEDLVNLHNLELSCDSNLEDFSLLSNLTSQGLCP